MLSPYERRIRACQERLRERGADAVVLFPSRNLFYLTGFDETPGERHLLLFVPPDGESVLLVPELYDEQVRQTTGIDDVRTWADDDDPVETLRTVVADLGLVGTGRGWNGSTGGGSNRTEDESDRERDGSDEDGTARILVDDTMWARFTEDLRTVLPGASVGLASEVLAPLRVRKDHEELDALRRAGTIADEVMAEIQAMGAAVVGTTERELAVTIERRLEDAGGRGVSFEPIVGSGPNGAKPHHGHGNRTIEAGDPVVLDFGTYVDAYPSDTTRTVVFDGDPPAEFVDVHEIVREAQEAGVAAVEPGVTAGAVDRAARAVIEAAGYGEQFLHRTGHGVGLDVHEEPYVVAGSDRRLEEGMVFSVEPGIYLPGEFGVRIEDLVVVTADGCERLNDTDRGSGRRHG